MAKKCIAMNAYYYRCVKKKNYLSKNKNLENFFQRYLFIRRQLTLITKSIAVKQLNVFRINFSLKLL